MAPFCAVISWVSTMASLAAILPGMASLSERVFRSEEILEQRPDRRSTSVLRLAVSVSSFLRESHLSWAPLKYEPSLSRHKYPPL